MKNYTQVYVKNSMEAAETYCRAFGAEITFEIKNDSGTAYEHCELSVNGDGFLAIGEAKNPCDIELVHKMKWETTDTKKIQKIIRFYFQKPALHKIEKSK